MKFSSPNDMKLKQKKKNAHKILKLHVILQSELIYSNRYVLSIFMYTYTNTHIFLNAIFHLFVEFKRVRERERIDKLSRWSCAFSHLLNVQFFLINVKIIEIGFDFWFLLFFMLFLFVLIHITIIEIFFYKQVGIHPLNSSHFSYINFHFYDMLNVIASDATWETIKFNQHGVKEFFPYH